MVPSASTYSMGLLMELDFGRGLGFGFRFGSKSNMEKSANIYCVGFNYLNDHIYYRG